MSPFDDTPACGGEEIMLVLAVVGSDTALRLGDKSSGVV